MAIFKLRCPDCAETFKWPSSDPWPDYCPNKACGAFVGQDPDNEIAVPFISLAKNKSADAVYKAMEKGAEHRANVAAEMTGLPVSDFSDMKMTNMKDNAKEGENSDIGVRPDNVVAQAMRQQGGPTISNYASRDALIAQSAGVAQGQYPNAGAKMQNLVRSQHQKYVPHGVSDIPALETQSPLYRRRS